MSPVRSRSPAPSLEHRAESPRILCSEPDRQNMRTCLATPKSVGLAQCVRECPSDRAVVLDPEDVVDSTFDDVHPTEGPIGVDESADHVARVDVKTGDLL